MWECYGCVCLCVNEGVCVGTLWVWVFVCGVRFNTCVLSVLCMCCL